MAGVGDFEKKKLYTREMRLVRTTKKYLKNLEILYIPATIGNKNDNRVGVLRRFKGLFWRVSSIFQSL